MAWQQCSECGAQYASAADSCAARFEQLLALDHSRQEPWGSRHGQAFAAFALQHPRRYSTSLDTAWAALYRIYCRREPPSLVFASLRRAAKRPAPMSDVALRPRHPVGAPSVTIVDLGEFAAQTYANRLDEWCHATLLAWGVPLNGPGAS